MIGSPHAYLSRNRSAITWVSDYRCPIWTFSNRTPVIGYPRDFHVNYARFNGFLSNVFYSCHNLVPRASFPLTSGRKTRALGATISGMRHRCRCAVSQITRIRLFPLFFQNGCSQSSRFLPQARRIVGSGTRMQLSKLRISATQVFAQKQFLGDIFNSEICHRYD